MSHFGILTLLLILCSLSRAAGEVYYITTNSTDPLCTLRPCLTLSQFANLNNYLHSNNTLVFLPGTHHLNTTNLTLSNMDSFVMKSENSIAQIKCASNSHIHFSQSQCIHITNLEFIGCGGNQVSHVDEFVVKVTKFKGQENSETALKLIKTTAQIVNTTFVSNRRGTYRKCATFFENSCRFDGFIGGAITVTNSSVDIDQSKFEDNEADLGGAICAEQHSIINMNGNVFIINNAFFGGAALHSDSSNIAIKACEFHNNNANSGGALSSISSTIIIEASEFHNNNADTGGALTSLSSTIIIEASGFHNNSASAGGVLGSSSSTIIVETSEFHNNSVTNWGGVLLSSSSNITMETSGFHNNSADVGGVLVSSTDKIITIKTSEFHNNSATAVGGVLNSFGSNIIIQASEFHKNSALSGGVLVLGLYFSSNITIQTSEFHDNRAIESGGVLLCTNNSIITISRSNFTKNHSPIGAIIYGTKRSKIYLHNSLLFDNNMADRYAVIYLSDSELVAHNPENVITFSNNIGSLVAFNSNITFSGNAVMLFVNNQSPQTASGDFQEGGAITLFQSSVYFDGACNLEHNHAENGGAIHSTESKLYVNGNVAIVHNTATRNGGGVYLSTSELICQQKSIFELFNNTAGYKGGGLHAISSPIKATSLISLVWYTDTRMNFAGNAAQRGGGLSLEANAKLYVLKYDIDYSETLDTNTIIFTANHADYGGAVYVDDDTNSGTCASDTKTECFFQVLAVHDEESSYLRTQSMHFSQNIANISGSTLYGGLLDRCAVSLFAEVHNKHDPDQNYEYKGNGESYFKDISTGESMLMSSLPVQVCLCINNEPNCTHQSYKEVKKGAIFTPSVVAVDQIGQPVSATIQTFLNFTESGIAEGQLARKIPAECTNLTFNVVSPHNSESLSLYASDGPCKDAEFSRATIEIHFLACSCPIGLQISGMNSTNCTCECHSDISQYVEHCDSHTGSFVKKNQSRAWIFYDNVTDGYVVYPNCPFDYCLPTSPPVDLNQPNGADAQCAFNRSSLLCASCRPGLSLSLGSSRCLLCPSYWLVPLIAITIAAILAGIALVALLLVLNVTVAVGTLNGLIFYANVMNANKNILLPFQKTNFITVFISWLNLELGIDTCYFPGMDTYYKSWLQLAFPAYVFLLIYMVIISSKSTKFARLIRKKDPVATLATLILFSYAKLIEVCFKSLSFGILAYPDGSTVLLWLPDATVKYLSVKHIPLFVSAVLILLVGLVFPTLLFLWQFLLRLPKGRISKLTENVRIKSFIEYYHTPYTAEHRYWTGLLLIVRIILYLVSAVNVSNDPTVALTAIILTVCCIFAFRLFFGGRLYRKWPMDVLETFFCLNILLFATMTWYSLNNPNSNKEAAAYTSVTITIVILLLIILYHVHAYTSLFSKIKKIKLGSLRMDDLDGPVNTDDHDTAPILGLPPVEPTFSVVELPKPRDLAAPDPEVVANTQHIPGAAEAVQVKEKEALSQV